MCIIRNETISQTSIVIVNKDSLFVHDARKLSDFLSNAFLEKYRYGKNVIITISIITVMQSSRFRPLL